MKTKDPNALHKALHPVTSSPAFKPVNPPADPRYPAAGEAAHTPTPYAIDTQGDFSGLCIISDFGRVAKLCESAEVDDEAKATAAFIVRACNENARLVEALKACRASLAMYAEDETADANGVDAALEKAEAALAAAKV